MLFNSIGFLIFFPTVVLLYYLLPHRARYLWLLAASWYFYMQWNALYILLLLFCTVVTYVSGLVLEKLKNAGETDPGRIRRRRVCVLAASLGIGLGLLGIFKYADFAMLNLNRVLSILHLQPIVWKYSIALPVGISFYTLQAMGYLIDVYRGEIYAERNFFRYALFLAFFPQLVAGPIERSRNLLVQLYTPKRFEWENLRRGALLMLWGFFLKMVIADRAAVIVNTVYGEPGKYEGFLVMAATFFFAIQIYCDFYGYSVIARGAARVLGIELTDNFNAPYFSQSVKEFWRRWHISLSGWFRDYLYIPLGGNRRGTLRRQANLLVVFAASGLWHGASLAYVAWGLLNGFWQIVEELLQYIKDTLRRICGVGDRADVFCGRLVKRVITFGLICLAWVFFRAGDFSDAFLMLRDMLRFDWIAIFDGSIFALGVEREYLRILCAAILLLAYMDYRKYKGVDMAAALLGQRWWFRILAEVGLLLVILLFGCYGVEYDTSEFIYFQF